MIFQTSFLKLVTFLLSLVTLFLLPLIILLSFPLVLLPRYLLSKIVPWFNPSLGKMVTSLSSVLSSDKMFSNPTSNILVNLTLEGNLDFEECCTKLQEKLLDSTLANSSLKYPELRQYITPYFGYYFWKWDPSFDIKNHVKIHQHSKERFSQEDMLLLREELLNKPWDKKKPLWEFITVPNYYPDLPASSSGPFTEIILRFHHSLGDGYSGLTLLVNNFSENKQEFSNAIPAKFQKSFGQTIKYILIAPFSISYKITELIILPLRNYPFKLKSKQQKLSKFLVDTSPRIPTSHIKQIKSHFDVCFTSVIFSIYSGLLRESLQLKNLPVPKEIPCFLPFPVPGHSAKLRNELTGVYVNLPIGEPDPVQRLKLNDKKYENLKNSHLPLIFTYAIKVGGSLLRFFLRPLSKNRQFPVGLSNFPAGNTLMYYNGQKVVDAYFNVQVLPGCCGVGVFILSYNDGIRWCITASSEIFSKQELHQMIMSIQKQIHELMQYAT